jgi:acyl-CoA synthetase (AMP-forming)/AMP-acid ligase II
MQELLDEIVAVGRREAGAAAFVDARGRPVMTYGRLARLIDERAGALAAAGLTAADVVAFGVPPGADGIAWLLACFRAGVAVALLDPGVAPERLVAQCRRAGATAVLLDGIVATLAGSAIGRRAGRAAGVRLADPRAFAARVLLTGPAVGSGAATVRVDRLAGTPVRPDWPPERLALVIFTSGTTQAPRGVIHTPRSLAANLLAVRDLAELGPDARVLGNAAHLLIPALLAGATVVLSPRRRSALARTTHASGVTHLTLAPHDAMAWAEAGGASPALRGLFLGSAPIRSAALRRILPRLPVGARTWCVYGMTELLLVAAVTGEQRAAHDELDGDLVGAPIAGTRIRIADDDEVRVSGPGLARGYVGEPPFTEAATGDLGRLDADGRLLLLGRRKEMLIRAGRNIYPTLYEPAIVERAGLADAALVGVPDDLGDERVVLWVVPAAGERPDAAVARTRSVVGGPDGPVDAFARPDDTFTIPSLPRGGRSGKVDRSALVAMAAARLGRARRLDPLLVDRA